MKYLVKFFVVTFFLIVSTYAFAEQKIVVLDMKYVLNNSKAGKGAQEFLKKKFNDNAIKFIDEENQLKEDEKNLIASKTSLTKEEYQKKTDVLRKKVIDYQSQRKMSLEKIAKQRLEAREKLLSTIDPILNKYIQENNISVVVDRKNIIGGQTDLDITKIIIKKLNNEISSIDLK